MSHQNDRRIRANRENAKNSTGPCTPEGKAKSSMNALKHGLLAESVVVPDCPDLETKQQFDELLQSISDEYSPVGIIEQLLVETIAVSYWRLRRALRMEAAEIGDKTNTHQKFFSDDPIGLHSLPGIKKTHMILRYETIIERRLNRATTRLEQLQSKRHGKNRVASSNLFGGDFKHPAHTNPALGTHPAPGPNEPNLPQTYAPSFVTPATQLPRTTPAGYPAYQACKSPEDKTII